MSDPGTQARDRWTAVLPGTGLRPTEAPVPVLSYSNDAWLVEDERAGAVVLRVCWRGDRARLLREAALGAALPAAVGYPAVLASGGLPDGSLTWTVTRRLAGRSLRDAWPGWSPEERARAVEAVAGMVTALHAFRPDTALHALLVPAPLPVPASAVDVAGRSINPWPDGLPVLLAEAGRRGAPPDLVRAAERMLGSDAHLGPTMDAAAPTVVHGDLHLDNLWSEDGRVTGLLDLEWARPAPPWVELAGLADEVELDEIEGISGHAELLAGLRQHAPELFAVDRLPERLRLLRVAAQLRQLVVWPVADLASAAPDHPLRRLEGLLDGPPPGS